MYLGVKNNKKKEPLIYLHVKMNHQQSCTVDNVNGNFINKFTGESSNESKTVT